MSREVLYVGMDESNHGQGPKSRVGEIIVATYTYSKRFWNETEKHPNRRDYNQVKSALKTGVDYIYTHLPHEFASTQYSNLPYVAPTLVGKILHLRYAPEIKLGLDGRLLAEDREKMMKEFENMGFEPEISNYIKKNKSHVGPGLVYLSHLIANELFRRSMFEIAEDSHYIPFDVIVPKR